jgi:hypothetical protein
MSDSADVFDLIDEVTAAGAALELDDAGQLRCRTESSGDRARWAPRIRAQKHRLVAMLTGDSLSRLLMQPHDLEPIDLEAAEKFAETIGVTPADAMAFRSELVAALPTTGTAVSRPLIVEVEAYRMLTRWLRHRQSSPISVAA